MPDLSITLEEFKARLPIVDVVARWVKLTRRGREHWGCCPFHPDKSPSFKVDPRRGRFHCFGCGAHGDALDFMAQIEGVELGGAFPREPNALRRLLDSHGLALVGGWWVFDRLRDSLAEEI